MSVLETIGSIIAVLLVVVIILVFWTLLWKYFLSKLKFLREIRKYFTFQTMSQFFFLKNMFLWFYYKISVFSIFQLKNKFLIKLDKTRTANQSPSNAWPISDHLRKRRDDSAKSELNCADREKQNESNCYAWEYFGQFARDN